MPDAQAARNKCVFSSFLLRVSPWLPAAATPSPTTRAGSRRRTPPGLGAPTARAAGAGGRCERGRSLGRGGREVTARGGTGRTSAPPSNPARLRGFSPEAGRKGLTAPLPPSFPPEVSLGNPPRYFQHFLNQGPLNRAAQTNWRQKRRSCHDWDQSNISALFALQLRAGLWLRCHRGKSAAARFLSAPGGGGRTRGAGAGRGGGGGGEEAGRGPGRGPFLHPVRRRAEPGWRASPSLPSGWGAPSGNAPCSAHVESRVCPCPASFLPSSVPLSSIPSHFPPVLPGGSWISRSLAVKPTSRLRAVFLGCLFLFDFLCKVTLTRLQEDKAPRRLARLPRPPSPPWTCSFGHCGLACLVGLSRTVVNSNQVLSLIFHR